MLSQLYQNLTKAGDGKNTLNIPTLFLLDNIQKIGVTKNLTSFLKNGLDEVFVMIASNQLIDFDGNGMKTSDRTRPNLTESAFPIVIYEIDYQEGLTKITDNLLLEKLKTKRKNESLIYVAGFVFTVDDGFHHIN